MPSMAKRYDRSGAIVLMVEHKGYLMVRRPHCAPFVMSVTDWEKLAPEAATAEKIQVSHGRVTVHDY